MSVREVRALKQERFGGPACQRVRGAIAKVQACGVNAFAIVAEGVAGDGELLQIKGYDSNGGGAKQRINSLRTLSCLLPVRL